MKKHIMIQQCFKPIHILNGETHFPTFESLHPSPVNSCEKPIMDQDKILQTSDLFDN